MQGLFFFNMLSYLASAGEQSSTERWEAEQESRDFCSYLVRQTNFIKQWTWFESLFLLFLHGLQPCHRYHHHHRSPSSNHSPIPSTCGNIVNCISPLNVKGGTTKIWLLQTVEYRTNPGRAKPKSEKRKRQIDMEKILGGRSPRLRMRRTTKRWR